MAPAPARLGMAWEPGLAVRGPMAPTILGVTGPTTARGRAPARVTARVAPQVAAQDRTPAAEARAVLVLVLVPARALAVVAVVQAVEPTTQICLRSFKPESCRDPCGSGQAREADYAVLARAFARVRGQAPFPQGLYKLLDPGTGTSARSAERLHSWPGRTTEMQSTVQDRR